MSDEDSGYEVVRELFEHHDDFPAPTEAEILHTHRMDDGLEVWFRRPKDAQGAVDLSQPDATKPYF